MVKDKWNITKCDIRQIEKWVEHRKDIDGTVKEMELGVDYSNIQQTMYEGEK